jgi:transcriptional regulator with XRE-family HTH domain
MADEATGSTVPRRQLGRYLRDLRNSQRLTVRAAAERLEWSEAKIWRIETGQVSLRSLDVETMCKIERQSLLTRVTAAPELSIVLNEAIVWRPVGGAQVMSDQLRRLLDASELPNVALRIMPFSAGLHHGVMSGPFEILRFPLNGDGRASEPPTVYVDGFTGDLYLDKQKEIERYDVAFADIWSASLNERASRDLLKATPKELG